MPSVVLAATGPPPLDTRERSPGSWHASMAARLGQPADNPDQIIAKKGLSALELMEQRDSHYASVLQTRKLTLLGRGYELQPASDDPQDQDIAEFVRWALEQVRGPWLQDCYELMDAWGKGYSLMEIIWGYADRGPWAGKAVPLQLKAKDQQYFAFALDDYDNILPDGIVQNPMVSSGLRMQMPANMESWPKDLKSNADGYNLRHPRDKFLHAVFNARAENPYGRGLGSVCYWYSWFKTEGGFKFWLVFLEKFGSPTAKIQQTEDYRPSGDQSADELKMKTILKSLQQETGVVVPAGLELGLLEAARAGDAGYERLIERCNAEISKVVLGQTLTTEQGDRGARALGEVHQDVMLDILRYDADLLSATINEQLVAKLVRYNFLGVEDYPRYVIPIEVQRDLKALSEAYTNLTNIGLKIPTKYAYEQTGIPQPEEDEEVLEGVKVPAPMIVEGDGAPGSPPEEAKTGADATPDEFAEVTPAPSLLKPEDRQAGLNLQDRLLTAGTLAGEPALQGMFEDLLAQVEAGEWLKKKSTRRPANSKRIRARSARP